MKPMRTVDVLGGPGRHALPPPARRYLHVRVPHEAVAAGWPSLYLVEKALRRERVAADRLVWQYTEHNASVLVAWFEVLPEGAGRATV